MNARGRSTVSDRELSAIAGEFDLTVRQLINEVGWRVATYYRRRKRLGRISADFALDLAEYSAQAGGGRVMTKVEVLTRLRLL